MSRIAFNLTPKDHELLLELTQSGKRNCREFERAYILQAPDKGKKQ
jgi:hypothetical protein